MERYHYTWRNIISGLIIYSSGDTLATLITGNVSLSRIIGMMILGGTIYAFEVPNWFRLIDSWTSKYENGFKKSATRMALALAYFNPLWIARHIFFIALFSGAMMDVTWQIFPSAGMSFIMNLPFSILGNYLIQNKISFRFRFLASSTFSALMAVSYALCAIWFK